MSEPTPSDEEVKDTRKWIENWRGMTHSQIPGSLLFQSADLMDRHARAKEAQLAGASSFIDAQIIEREKQFLLRQKAEAEVTRLTAKLEGMTESAANFEMAWFDEKQRAEKAESEITILQEQLAEAQDSACNDCRQREKRAQDQRDEWQDRAGIAEQERDEALVRLAAVLAAPREK